MDWLTNKLNAHLCSSSVSSFSFQALRMRCTCVLTMISSSYMVIVWNVVLLSVTKEHSSYCYYVLDHPKPSRYEIAILWCSKMLQTRHLDRAQWGLLTSASQCLWPSLENLKARSDSTDGGRNHLPVSPPCVKERCLMLAMAAERLLPGMCKHRLSMRSLHVG